MKRVSALYPVGVIASTQEGAKHAILPYKRLFLAWSTNDPVLFSEKLFTVFY
jgi:hypothetical protein